jgi:antitoxin component YwqK of YwqJK toxin-antitoxin module
MNTNSSEQSLLTNNNQSTKGGVMKTNEEVEVKYWDNGNKKSETHYKDGKLDGIWTWWYEDGTKEYEQHYKDGKPYSSNYDLSWIGNERANEDQYKEVCNVPDCDEVLDINTHIYIFENIITKKDFVVCEGCCGDLDNDEFKSLGWFEQAYSDELCNERLKEMTEISNYINQKDE